MNFKLICTGKTTEAYVLKGVEEYEKRLKHYLKYQRIELSVKHKGSREQHKEEEGEKRTRRTRWQVYVGQWTEVSHCSSNEQQLENCCCQ